MMRSLTSWEKETEYRAPPLLLQNHHLLMMKPDVSVLLDLSSKSTIKHKSDINEGQDKEKCFWRDFEVVAQSSWFILKSQAVIIMSWLNLHSCCLIFLIYQLLVILWAFILFYYFYYQDQGSERASHVSLSWTYLQKHLQKHLNSGDKIRSRVNYCTYRFLFSPDATDPIK